MPAALNPWLNICSVVPLKAATRASVSADVPAGTDKRLLSHTLFASLSGILIAFRKYPGRSEEESLAHMQRVGQLIKDMFDVYLGRAGDTTRSGSER